MQVTFIDQWHTHPLFIRSVTDRVVSRLAEVEDLKRLKLIFTGHSIPTAMSARSDYAGQIKESAQAVVRLLCEPESSVLSAKLSQAFENAGSSIDLLPWVVAYQSRSGSPHELWLEPDVSVEIARAAQDGFETVLLIPIGFLCDHSEVLFDLDILAAGQAHKSGMEYRRSETVGVHPAFIEMLAGEALKKAESFYPEIRQIRQNRPPVS